MKVPARYGLPSPTAGIAVPATLLTPEVNPTQADLTDGWKDYSAALIISTSDLQRAGLARAPIMHIKYPPDWTVQSFADGSGNAVFVENGRRYIVRFNTGGLEFRDTALTNTDDILTFGSYTARRRIIAKNGHIFLISIDIGNEVFTTNILFDVPPTNQTKYLTLYNVMLHSFTLTPYQPPN
jgi:hypothetical protein